MSTGNDKRLDELSVRTDAGFKEVKAEFKDVRAEMRDGFARVDRRFEKVDEEFKNVRQEMKDGFNRVDDRFHSLWGTLVIASVGVAPAFVVSGAFEQRGPIERVPGEKFGDVADPAQSLPKMTRAVHA